ncbi:MAG TPA: exodeoxyribonuclease III [Candidatus Limnocylindrales bacterium]
MRIATWNVNSLKARLDRVEEWLGIASPDVLLMQETKLFDETAPVMPFAMAGYELAHHGQGRWNGVAIASRVGIADVVTNFGDGPVVGTSAGSGAGLDGGPAEEAASESGGTADDGIGPEARMISARCGGIRVVSIYAPNGRALDTPFYEAKLSWFDRLSRWLEETQDPAGDLLIGGDFNVAPDDLDVYDPRAYIGATHVSPAERAALARMRDWGLVDLVRPYHPETGFYTWWDYRAGNFHKNLGMRIDHLYATRSVAERVTGAERDRDARKGKLPSDHAPLYVDLAG